MSGAICYMAKTKTATVYRCQIRASSQLQVMYLNAKERRLAEKLRDAYNVNFQDVTISNARDVYGMGTQAMKKSLVPLRC